MLLKNEYFLKIKYFTENWVYQGKFFFLNQYPTRGSSDKENILAKVTKSLPSLPLLGEDSD